MTRAQFRTVSPDPDRSLDPQDPGYGGPEGGHHTVYRDQSLLLRIGERSLGAELDNLTLQFLKSGNSEMGDSGISSDPASITSPGMSPKSDSTEGSKGSREGSKESREDSKDSREGSKNSTDPADKIIPPGKKRDTMLRELKSKLKEKFPSDTLASSQTKPREQFIVATTYSIQARQSEVGAKLSKLFGDRTQERCEDRGRYMQPENGKGNQEPSKAEFLERLASLRRVSKGAVSPSSTLPPVEESCDSCDCSSSGYNQSEYTGANR